MATIRKTNGSVASQPVKAGETTPTNIKPHVTFDQCATVATQKIDALIRGGVECITYLAAAFLVGHLSRAEEKVKLSVMRDEFALMLGKRGLGGTQTKKYLDYAFKAAGMMFKECQFGMEVAALIAAETPDKAHDAVKSWLDRHTKGKKTEHGFALTDASHRLNVLGVYLGFEEDPAKPEALPGTADNPTDEQKAKKRRENQAKAINKDPSVLQSVETGKLVETVAKVVSFDVLVAKHVAIETKVAKLEAEFAAIQKAYKDRIAELKKPMGKKVKGRASSETVQKAA